MVYSLFLLLLFLPLDVDIAEVSRRGDFVTFVDGLSHSGGVGFGQLLSEVIDDPWHLSVYTEPDNALCEELKAQWPKIRSLRAWSDPEREGGSWAKLHFFDSTDSAQSWRLDDIAIESYPVVLLQPPSSGRFGRPETVVFKGSYDGNPESLSDGIRSALHLYAKSNYGGVGAPAPWDKPRERPLDRIRPLLNIPPLIPDTVSPDARRLAVEQFPWSSLFMILTGNWQPAALAIGAYFLFRYRESRKAAGKRLLLTDEEFSALGERLRPPDPKE